MAAGRPGADALAASLRARLKIYARNEIAHAGSEARSEPAAL